MYVTKELREERVHAIMSMSKGGVISVEIAPKLLHRDGRRDEGGGWDMSVYDRKLCEPTEKIAKSQ